jgi:hypothetical protein
LLAAVGAKGGTAIRPLGMFAATQSLRTLRERITAIPEIPYAAM